MSNKVTLVIPEAPVPISEAIAEQRKLPKSGLRLAYGASTENSRKNAVLAIR